MNNNKKLVGIYNDEDLVLSAVKRVKAKGYKIKEVFSPIPLMEVVEELGYKTRIPFMEFVFGVSSVTLLWAALYYTFVMDYPLDIGGKPSHTLSFVVIIFVMTINLTSVTSLLLFFVRQKLAPGKQAKIIDPRVVDDKFAIVIDEAGLSSEQIENVSALLTETGAEEVNKREGEFDDC